MNQKEFFIIYYFFASLVFCVTNHSGNAQGLNFDENYVVKYGNDHFTKLDNGNEIQLSLDENSGSGITSKMKFTSGFFEILIKLPTQPSPGVVCTFYLTSKTDNSGGNHDEIDFEFLGTDGPPFILQTNIFADDSGHREEQIELPFDPTKEFHKYGIIWNNNEIKFLVDNNPIRVYVNQNGVRYPKGPMAAEASIWNGDDWASGGRKIDWSKAPFQLHYRGFTISPS